MKSLLHNLLIHLVNLLGVTLVWLVQWTCLWLFAITFLDGIVLHLPHDTDHITTQPWLALIILFLVTFAILTIVDLPCKFLKEKGIFKIIYEYWRHKKTAA